MSTLKIKYELLVDKWKDAESITRCHLYSKFTVNSLDCINCFHYRGQVPGEQSIICNSINDNLKGRINNADGSPCIKCSKVPTKEGHDSCLGTLPDPDIMNACCGHGEDSSAYIQYYNKPRIGGEKAIKEQNELILGRPFGLSMDDWDSLPKEYADMYDLDPSTMLWVYEGEQ